MAEVVNEWLPRLGINVILAEDEVAAYVHLDDPDLYRRPPPGSPSAVPLRADESD